MAVAALIVLAAAGALLVRSTKKTRASDAVITPVKMAPANVWPASGAVLAIAALDIPADFGRRRIYIDPGHGAPNNAGNTSCYCVAEQDFTLRASEALAQRLEATGHFETRLSRSGEARVPYRERVEDAARWNAEAFISLHSDVRGQFEDWSPDAGMNCRKSLAAPGFTVLLSDEGGAPLRDGRFAIARAVAQRMLDAGFAAYHGADYAGRYEADPVRPGVFMDRHEPAQRIFVLHAPVMPSILIETHHALDPREATRWEDAKTHDAFGAAVAAALVEALPALAKAPASH